MLTALTDLGVKKDYHVQLTFLKRHNSMLIWTLWHTKYPFDNLDSTNILLVFKLLGRGCHGKIMNGMVSFGHKSSFLPKLQTQRLQVLTFFGLNFFSKS
jgi:hypothetical protein